MWNLDRPYYYASIKHRVIRLVCTVGFSAVAQYLTTHLWEFYQIWNSDAAGYRDELLKFWDQRLKAKVTTRLNLWLHKHFGIFSLVSRMLGHALIKISLPGPRDSDDILNTQRSRSQRYFFGSLSNIIWFTSLFRGLNLVQVRHFPCFLW